MNYEIDEIEEVESLGECEDYVYDVGMRETPHTFFANDVLVHNSIFLDYGKLLSQENIPMTDENIEACVNRCREVDIDVTMAINENLSNICNDIMQTPNYYKFETEEVFSKLLITSKKKYIAKVAFDKTTQEYPENDFTIKGMEFKKSNLSETVKSFLKETTIKIMNGATQEEVERYMSEMFYKLPELPIEDIAYTQGVRNIAKYSEGSQVIINNDQAICYFPKKTPYHVIGALVLNALIDADPILHDMERVCEGDKANIVFVCPTSIFGDIKAVAYIGHWNPRLYDYFKLDIEYMFQRLLIGPLAPVFEAVGFNITMDSILKYSFLDKENNYIQRSLF